MWHRKLNLVGVATLLWAVFGAAQAAAAGIVNGGFEIGSFAPPFDSSCTFGYYDGFTGWTKQGHVATPPLSPLSTAPPDCALPVPAVTDLFYGAQVLTKDDFVSANPVVPPEGTHFALLSTLPNGFIPDENGDPVPEDGEQCPTTLARTLSPPSDVDGDGFYERDVTTLSQQFKVDQVPATISFDWSFLAGENRNPNENWLHDDFQATLTPISPPGAPIQILGVTAGNKCNPAYGPPAPYCYRGTFTFIDPSQLDGIDYQVLTLPAGGPTDCHHSAFGRTSFRKSEFPIPAAGVWEIKFFVGDDGGDAVKTTGVLLDNVELKYGSHLAPALSPAGMVLATLILAAVGIFGLAARGVRPQPTTLVLGALLLFGAVLLLSHSQAASGALRPPGGAVIGNTGSDDNVAQVRRTPLPTGASPRPTYNTQTPIVS